MPGIVTKAILHVFVPCALQRSVDEGFVNEKSAPKLLQNSRRNIALCIVNPVHAHVFSGIELVRS